MWLTGFMNKGLEFRGAAGDSDISIEMHVRACLYAHWDCNRVNKVAIVMALHAPHGLLIVSQAALLDTVGVYLDNLYHPDRCADSGKQLRIFRNSKEKSKVSPRVISICMLTIGSSPNQSR